MPWPRAAPPAVREPVDTGPVCGRRPAGAARRGLQRAGRSVRTALLYSAGWLVQWHEGAHSAVEAEWGARAQVTRVTAMRACCNASRGAASLQDPVQLASLHDADRSTDVARRMHALSREHEEG